MTTNPTLPSDGRQRPPFRRTRLLSGICAAALVTLTGCSDLSGPALECAIPLDRFVDGGVERSGIPALTNPKVAFRGAPDITYLSLSDRVIGITFNGQPIAIPHKLLWHHEVVNLEVPGEELTVTYSPLTGSSMVFDRSQSSLGPLTVSNYVLYSNLVMEDETGTLWPQMSTLPGCGPMSEAALQRVRHEEMTLGAWMSVHENTAVVSQATGFDFLYTLYPYGDYALPNNTRLLYPVPAGIDTRRPPKELVFGVPGEDGGGMAFPLSLLDQLRGSFSVLVSVANAELDRPVAVFYNAFAQGALAYVAELDGQRLTFEVVNGERRDVQTGTAWDFQGTGYDGPLSGRQLEAIGDAHVAYWFAWAEFQPATEIWSPPVAVSLLPSGDWPPELPDAPVDWELSTR